MIAGMGTDIVEIRRIAAKEQLIAGHVLNEREQAFSADWCGSRKTEFLAGRWAAKEAFAKALGTGIGEHCSFDQITVLPDDKGRPVVSVTGNAEKTLNALGVSRIHVSISHERDYAVATVILEK